MLTQVQALLLVLGVDPQADQALGDLGQQAAPSKGIGRGDHGGQNLEAERVEAPSSEQPPGPGGVDCGGGEAAQQHHAHQAAHPCTASISSESSNR